MDRLATLERTLVGAAARLAQRRKRRRRRALLLVALAVPLALAAAASVAATGTFFGGMDLQLATLRDERLAARPAEFTKLSRAVRALPRDRASERAWLVAGHRVVGYTAANGSFCYRFGELTAGCLHPGVLTSDNPLAATTDYGPATFRVYGIAADDVAGVSLQGRGMTVHAIVTRNAFFLERKSFGGTRGLSATLIARMRDGTTRHVPLRIGAIEHSGWKSSPRLPGGIPGANTAA
jgi:hypothetical protein